MMVKGDVRDRPEDRPVQVGASEHCLQEEKKKSVYFSIYSVFQYSVYLQKIQMFGDELSISM